MNICIIGGSGFVGAHLINLIKHQHKITIIDKAPSSSFSNLVVTGDIRDQEFLKKNLKGFDLVIHCGGCMLSEREMHSRIEKSLDRSVPVTNYGIAIAHMNGILERSIRFFQNQEEEN